MSHYLDSSVIVALLLPDAHSSAADAWLTKSKPTFVISDFGKVEFAAVVSRRARMKGLTSAAAAFALRKFDTWHPTSSRGVSCTHEHMIDAELLVRDFSSKLSAPDAVHLAIARSYGLILTTFDTRLADAARSQNVTIVVPQ